MKRIFFFSLCLMVLASFANWGIASAPVQTGGSGTWPFEIDDTGGPDEFGYTWIDSDEPGGPAVDFIDISGYGTEVTGLGDDNFVGPYPIGFSFRYYWYDVSQFWVGSNGWMKFSTAGQLAQPMPTIPTSSQPNDLLCPLAADLFFENPPYQGHAYYWSNNNDSLIVSWHDVPTWVQGMPHGDGSFTFQVILTTVDSSITFQYGVQQGAVSNNSVVVGIENNTGTIGLQVMYGLQPTSNYAVLFEYPDTIAYEVHDMAVADVMNDGSFGMFDVTGSDVDIWCRICNAGNQDETDATVTAEIRNNVGVLVWDATESLGAMTAGEAREITFSTPFAATDAGTYKVSVDVDLTGDMNAANDLLLSELGIVDIPGELGYDDGLFDYGWGWAGGDGGMGVRFAPPVYPADISQVSFYFSGTTMVPHDLKIIDDDGGNGAPGTDLYSEAITPTATGIWLYYDINPPVEITDGCFYLALIQGGESSSFGLDTTNMDPPSRQTWEYTGVWAPFRDQLTSEYMIRCTFDAETSAVALVDPTVASYTLLENYPNPFNPTTTIRYNMPAPGMVTLKVFDINGRLINTLVNGQNPQGMHRIIWDGTDMNGNKLSSGIYFYQIETPHQNETAKMVLIK
jgi:hypothetical protein